jgi:ABC-type uncharacterized transport system ATPase subunit
MPLIGSEKSSLPVMLLFFFFQSLRFLGFQGVKIRQNTSPAELYQADVEVSKLFSTFVQIGSLSQLEMSLCLSPLVLTGFCSVCVESCGGEEYPERLAHLIQVLEINVNWRMHAVSDGERKRVMIAVGLLKPWEVLLLDEVTVDLDVVVRRSLLNHLIQETEQRRATIIYATHIFDGLGGWPI